MKSSLRDGKWLINEDCGGFPCNKFFKEGKMNNSKLFLVDKPLPTLLLLLFMQYFWLKDDNTPVFLSRDTKNRW